MFGVVARRHIMVADNLGERETVLGSAKGLLHGGQRSCFMVVGNAASIVDGVAGGCGGWREWVGELERDREGGKARGVGFGG